MSKNSTYYCFFPTCGHRTTTLQNILGHLLDRHNLWVGGMDYELDLVYDFFCSQGWVSFFEDFLDSALPRFVEVS